MAGIMSIASMALNPYSTVKLALRNTVITFFMSMLSGFLLEYTDLPQLVKFGISGTIGLFAIWIYDILFIMQKKIKKNPDILFSIFKKRG